MSFGDLELHGHFLIFFLGVNWSGPKTNSTTNHNFIGPWDDFIVHGVSNPLGRFCLGAKVLAWYKTRKVSKKNTLKYSNPFMFKILKSLWWISERYLKLTIPDQHKGVYSVWIKYWGHLYLSWAWLAWLILNKTQKKCILMDCMKK